MDTKYSTRLKTAIESLDISQAELAKKTGVTEATISNYINAKKMPQLSVVEKIADILGLSVDYLLGRTTHMYLNGNSKDILDLSKLNKSEITELKYFISFLEYKRKNLGKGEAI